MGTQPRPVNVVTCMSVITYCYIIMHNSHTVLSVYSTHALIGSRIKAILDILHHRDLDKNVDYFYNHPR